MANNISEKNIHRFPGHMKKAYVKIEEQLKMIDFVIIVLDARAPFSSANEYLIKIFNQKPKLFILNKEDMGDPSLTKKWIESYTKEDVRCIALNSKQSFKNLIKPHLDYLVKAKKEKNQKKGIKNSIFRGIIVGIPNVGKSTIINQIYGSKRAEASNRPGVTKSVNWIKISNEFFIMDSPGILTPRFDNDEEAIKLALIGSIKQEILPIDKIVNFGLSFLKDFYLSDFKKYLHVDVDDIVVKNMSNEELINVIAEKFIPKLKDGFLNINQAKIKFLNDFRNAIIAKICLDRI